VTLFRLWPDCDWFLDGTARLSGDLLATTGYVCVRVGRFGGVVHLVALAGPWKEQRLFLPGEGRAVALPRLFTLNRLFHDYSVIGKIGWWLFHKKISYFYFSSVLCSKINCIWAVESYHKSKL